MTLDPCFFFTYLAPYATYSWVKRVTNMTEKSANKFSSKVSQWFIAAVEIKRQNFDFTTF
jgi:hypothetical protein